MSDASGSRSGSVAERIQARILDGTYRQGERLPGERELALELRVNRSSVREALKKLEELRLVRIHQGSGIRVRSLEGASLELIPQMLLGAGRLDLSLLRDLLELREVFVLGVLRLAIERAEDPQLRELAELLETACRPEISDDDFLHLVEEAQRLIARMTRNQVALMLGNALARFLERPPAQELARRIERRRLFPHLKRLAYAVMARDGDTAVRAMRELSSLNAALILRQGDAVAQR
ncbi:MAG: FadR family transcriptional regulator [Myxococcales bacterium]|nr:FadR family transcriptional regulator [Myxococcales bacterium]